MRHSNFSGQNDALQQDFVNRSDLRLQGYTSHYAGHIGEISLADQQNRPIIKLNDTQQLTRRRQGPHSATSHIAYGIQLTSLTKYQRLNTHAIPSEEYQHHDADVNTSGNEGKVTQTATTATS